LRVETSGNKKDDNKEHVEKSSGERNVDVERSHPKKKLTMKFGGRSPEI